ncbi:cupin domain-containing protein [Agaribacterium haliotis]|uniref:cupin domain-containing protein n=1 Tax=Agaribacterium haliotis TaxID=2013869 RepID=UPI000BB53ABB|nr:cupin domain-containing protein [Agaribacterium haliotis]
MAKHIVMSENAGASVLAQQNAPEFSSADFPEGWSGAGLEASGVFMFVLKLEEGAAEFDIHASEDQWLAYVVSGAGTLFAGTAENVKTEGMAYEAGDFITFEANTPHGWLGDGNESRLLFVKQA